MDSRILHYEFVTGESVNITVSAEIAEVIYDSRRMEHASNERSRYHTAFSLDSEDYEGTNLVSEKTPDDLMEELEDREHLLDCLAHLSENQRQRILMLAQGMSITEIARVQHADRTTVRESIQAARKKWEGKPDSFRASVLKGMMHFVELYHGEFSEERLLRALRSIHPVDIYRIGQDDPAKLRGWKKYVFPIYTAYNGKCRKDALPMKF